MSILNLDEIYDMANKLPQVSPAAIQLLSMIDNPRTTRNQIVDLIKTDEVLFAQCFKNANSAAFASMREYKTIEEIVDILGFNLIKKVALMSAAKSIIRDQSVWVESVYIAVAAQYLAKKIGMDQPESDAVYMAALFLNYGSFMLKKNYPALHAKCRKIDDFAKIMEAESKEFGYTYPEVSALALAKMNLPKFIIDIIAKQKNAYKEAMDEKNVCIELARVLHSVHQADIESIQNRMTIDDIKSMLTRSRVAVIALDIHEASIDNIGDQVKELAN